MRLSCPLQSAPSHLPAWIEREKVWTYEELNLLVNGWIQEMRSKGVKPLSRIAVYSSPSPFLAALFFAAWHLGAAVFPLNLRLPKTRMEEAMRSVATDFCYDPLGALGSSLVCLEQPKRGIKGNLRTLDGTLPAVFIMTSGSTAKPKTAVLSLSNLLKNAEGALDVLDLRENDRYLLNLPLFHVGGLGVLLRSILAGAAVVTSLAYPDITHISCIPTQLYRASPVYKTLRCVLLGGAPIHSYPSYLPIIATYGLTEMGSMVLAKKMPTDGYLGFALPERKIKIGEDGEILVGGTCLFQGYWKEGKIEAPGDWFATKDLGKFDPIRGFQVVGRKDWQFISGGENIQPEEIEKVLLQIDGIEEAVVIPKNDPEFGQRPVAFIQGKIDPASLNKKLASFLPKYKIPVSFIFLEEFPRQGIKIDRKALVNSITQI